jgi:hypothetical protein
MISPGKYPGLFRSGVIRNNFTLLKERVGSIMVHAQKRYKKTEREEQT